MTGWIAGSSLTSLHMQYNLCRESRDLVPWSYNLPLALRLLLMMCLSTLEILQQLVYSNL